jgi:hypothetical protein
MSLSLSRLVAVQNFSEQQIPRALWFVFSNLTSFLAAHLNLWESVVAVSKAWAHHSRAVVIIHHHHPLMNCDNWSAF